MPRKIPRLLWLLPPLAYFLYFYGLSAKGMVGPDEPRYAAIAREMARSGDWITPRLWGAGWFEKPPLLYWMSGAAFRLGLGPDLAPRLPVAIVAAAFLIFYWWILKREFSCLAASIGTLILGTTAGWIGFSQVGHMDVPLAALFSAAMLLALPWVAKRDTRMLPAVAILLGLAVLAKSGVPLVLALPLAAWGSLDLLRPRVVLPFLVVALPWYVVCYLKNGQPFLQELFVKQQFQRLTSTALLHSQPWWFYGPALLALLLPWAPLLPLVVRRSWYGDRRMLFLASVVIWGLVFFSLAPNKLYGYLLPILPAAAALLGVALDKIENARPWLALCALLLVAYPIAAAVLPDAVAMGLSRAPLPAFRWWWLLPAAIAPLAWFLDARGRRVAAVAAIAVGVAAGTAYLKYAAAPALDRVATARPLWSQIAGRAAEVCVEDVGRAWRYGLNYYSVTPLPDCKAEPKPLHVRQSASGPPFVAE